MIKMKYFLMSFLFVPMMCFADLKNLYIQMDNKEYNLEGVIVGLHGNIESTNEPSKYIINLPGKTMIIDVSSANNIKQTMAFLFPDQIFMSIEFSNVMPNTVAYVDNEKYGNINGEGNFNKRVFHKTKPGTHPIELKKNDKVFAHANVNVEKFSSVECAGRENMRCEVLSD